MSETRVVHINDHVEGAVYIGRAMPRQGFKASFWANPFKIGDRIFGTDLTMTRADVIASYQGRAGHWPEFWRRLPELRGKPLACWCRHDRETRTADNECHGDWLVALLSEFTDEKLQEIAGETRA